MSVQGCIDSNGAISGIASKDIRAHGLAESNGKRWRWLIWTQEFVHIGPGAVDILTTEETFAVWDWLRKRDFTDDETIPERGGN